jgi:site-specific recombinase XerD
MLNNSRQKQGKSQLFIRITVDSKRAELATKIYVNPILWDKKNHLIKSKDLESQLANTQISDILNSIKKKIIKMQSLEEEITAIKLKAFILGKSTTELNSKNKTSSQAFNYHHINMMELLKVGKICQKTVYRYQNTEEKFKNFLKENYNQNDIELIEIRLKHATEFNHYLLTNCQLQLNTAHKHIKNLKKILSMSVGLDWIPTNTISQFKCSYKSPKREILNQVELDRLMKKKISINRLEEVRDVFIFCCYTGFSFSDIFKLDLNAVSFGLDGERWIYTTRLKTGVKENVPLLPIPLKIIEKYKNHPFCVSNNKLLPVKSNQKYNAYLQELADICEINKHLTSHIARHTFATTVTLANGVPIETVSSMLGHTNISTTQIYAKVVEEKVSSDMKILRQKLSVVFPNQKAI